MILGFVNATTRFEEFFLGAVTGMAYLDPRAPKKGGWLKIGVNILLTGPDSHCMYRIQIDTLFHIMGSN
jgi:hypothetical protein